VEREAEQSETGQIPKPLLIGALHMMGSAPHKW
jgi:hypothetical protein